MFYLSHIQNGNIMQVEEVGEKEKKFMEYDTYEEFEKRFILLHKQELALKEGRSYFDVSTSNMDGTAVGEMFDNPLRIEFIKRNNPEFYKRLNYDEALERARKEYEEDKLKVDSNKNKDS